MFCPKCRIDTGKELFCEFCGCQTVDKLDDKNQENLKRNKRPSIPMVNFKNLIIVAVSIIAVFIVYSSIKSINSPDIVAEKYINFITTGEAKKAFKMIDLKESNFVTADYFEKYIENLGVIGKKGSIIPSEDNDFFAAFINMQEQYSGFNSIMPRDIRFYKAQIDSDTFPLVVIRKGKKFGVLDNWVIDGKELTLEWKIQAPKGAKVYVDGKEVNNVDEVHAFGGFNTLFAPEQRHYIINSIFPIDYEVSATLEGAKNLKKVCNPQNPVTVLGFEPSEDLLHELTDIAEDFIMLYYADAPLSQYKDIVHDDAMFFSNTNKFKKYKSRNLKSLNIISSSIDDINHARADFEVFFDYEQDEITNIFTGETATVNGTAVEILNLSFKKEGDKWLIVDTGYLY